MTSVWVNAVSMSGCNVRATATTTARVVRVVSAYGELANLTHEVNAVDGYRWSALRLPDAEGYARADVHEVVPLRSSVRLSVPYRSQTAPDAAKWDNDCMYAMLAMLMQFRGVYDEITEIAKKGGMITDTVQPFWRGIQAAKGYGFTAEPRIGTQITDIIKSLHAGEPIGMLVNYEHLRPTEKYAHFVVVTGYEFDGSAVNIICHDPYQKADAVYPASQFARAIGDMWDVAKTRKLNNYEFQAFVITKWPTPIPEPEPTEPPPPSGDESPALIRLAAIHREIAALAAEAITIDTTIKG